MTTRRWTPFHLAMLVVSAVAMLGCDRQGPQRFELAGVVRYEGEPIPFGWIVFSPEGDGPGATADIEDGRYQTPADWGTIGGPHTIEIVGFDGVAVPDQNEADGVNEAGRPHIQCVVMRDIPTESATMDFDLTNADRAK